MDPQSDDRPLPFVLRVAAEWFDMENAPGPQDNALFFRARAALTGDVSVTSLGRDVQFSDLGITP